MPHGKKHGLYENIRLKRARIKAGSKERMRKPGTKGAPTAAQFRAAAKTAKKKPKAKKRGKR
jgi:cysteine sulfinate desulfinase/cysteine desulfurase-like protein